jgi:hypothetical protein
MTEPSVHSSSFWKPTRRHRFDSAIVVLIALNVFPRLGQKEQQEVEHELTEVFKKTAATPYTAWREIVGPSSDHVAVLRGIAMARLGFRLELKAWTGVHLYRAPGFAVRFARSMPSSDSIPRPTKPPISCGRKGSF